MNLFWVETEDHHEDWFVVAHDQRQAEAFFERDGGYEMGDANAVFICALKESVESTPRWPTMELLEACGAKILRTETPRVVEINNRQFCEGLLENEILQASDNLFEAQGQGRPNKTKPRTRS